MGVQKPVNISFPWKQRPDGWFDGAYIPPNRDNSWKVAPAFDIYDDLDIEIIHPRAEATSPIARWKWAHWDDTYEIFFEFTGGRPPYRLSLPNHPAGAGLGNAGNAKEQVFDFIVDPDIPGRYDLEFPEDFGLIKWKPTELQRGHTHSFVVVLEDMAGRVIRHEFNVTADTPANPKFRYLNSVAGNNAHAGTRVSPMQTFPHAYALPDAGDFILVFENGTYPIYSVSAGNNADISGVNKPKSFIGRGDNTVLDMNNGHFTGAPNDVFFDNLRFDGSRSAQPNPRINSWGGRFDRLFYQRISATNNSIGIQTNQDNPCVIFTPDQALWVNRSKHLGIRNCKLDSTSKSALAIIFCVEHIIIRKCKGLSLNMDAHIALGKDPVGMFLCMKDSCTNAEISYCDVGGFTNNSLISWLNQSPENSSKQRTRFCKLDYTGNTMFAAIAYNLAASAVNSRGTNQRIERCSIKSSTTPTIATPGGAGGEPVKVSGLLYSGTGALFSNNQHAVSVDTANVSVAGASFNSDMKMVSAIKAANLGVRGGQMSTTMVH